MRRGNPTVRPPSKLLGSAPDLGVRLLVRDCPEVSFEQVRNGDDAPQTPWGVVDRAALTAHAIDNEDRE